MEPGHTRRRGTPRLATAFSVDAVTRLGSGPSSSAVIDAFAHQIQIEIASSGGR
jgi:hypothetical protein